MDIRRFSQLGNKARWANTTPEQRQVATAAARAARKRAAKARRKLKGAKP